MHKAGVRIEPFVTCIELSLIRREYTIGKIPGSK